MIRDDYITFTGAQYLREMFNRTTDGKLTIGDGEGKLATFPMDWDGQTAEMLVQRYDNLLEHLTRLGEQHERWATSAEGMPQALQAVWDTYIRPFPDHGMDEATLEEIWQKEDMGQLLSESEQRMSRLFDRWYMKCALERLPYNRRSPIYLINRARRYERLVSLKAPAVVLRSEARCLAEEMALYYCLKSNAYICRCCGNGYDLGSNGGYIDYSICPVCYWEEDGCGEDEDSDTNGDTLRNYRKKFYAKQSGEIA